MFEYPSFISDFDENSENLFESENIPNENENENEVNLTEKKNSENTIKNNISNNTNEHIDVNSSTKELSNQHSKIDYESLEFEIISPTKKNTNNSNKKLLEKKRDIDISNDQEKKLNNEKVIDNNQFTIGNEEEQFKTSKHLQFETKKIRHSKYSKDNIIKGVKCLIKNICIIGFNIELKKCNINKLKNRQLLKIKQLDDFTKASINDNIKFFEKKIEDILKNETTTKCKKEEKDNNSILIEDLYDINNNGNEFEKKIIHKFINFLDMKLEQFLNYLILYLSSGNIDQKGKEIIKENEDINDNIIYPIIKEHSKIIIDQYLKKKMHNIDNYKKKFISILKKLPDDIKKSRIDGIMTQKAK